MEPMEVEVAGSSQIMTGNATPVNPSTDPLCRLLPEMFDRILGYCTSSTLNETRLVSKSWNIACEKEWRKLKFIRVHTGAETIFTSANNKVYIFSLQHFMEVVNRNENDFQYNDIPFRRMIWHRFDLGLPSLPNPNENLLMKDFMERCVPFLTHLRLEICRIHDVNQFLSGVMNLRKLELTRVCMPWHEIDNVVRLRAPAFGPEMIEDEARQARAEMQRELRPLSLTSMGDVPVLRNLKQLKIDYLTGPVLFNRRLMSVGNQFEGWISFLKCVPNLEKLEIWSETLAPSFNLKDFLESLKELSKISHFRNLNQIDILFTNTAETTGDGSLPPEIASVGVRRFRRHMEPLWGSQLPSFRTLNIQLAYTYPEHDDNDHEHGHFPDNDENLPLRERRPDREYFETRAFEVFGGTLKSVKIFSCLQNPTQFPGQSEDLANLTKLSISYWLAGKLKDARNLPNLMSLEVLVLPGDLHENKMKYDSVTYQDWNREVTSANEDDGNQNQNVDENPSTNGTAMITEDDEISEDEDDANEEVAPDNFCGFLFAAGHRRLRNAAIFANVTDFRLEHAVSHQVFRKLPKWMPNVTSLAARISSDNFAVVCGKWGNLEKLLILQTKIYSEDVDNFVPGGIIDDCAILGRRHLTDDELKCSHNYAVFGKQPKSRSEMAVRLPNIRNLQNLRYFKIEKSTYDMMGEECPILTDISVLQGILNLPKLEYLDFIGDLKPETVSKIMRKISKCVVYTKRQDAELNQEEIGCRRRYYSARKNFVSFEDYGV